MAIRVKAHTRNGKRVRAYTRGGSSKKGAKSVLGHNKAGYSKPKSIGGKGTPKVSYEMLSYPVSLLNKSKNRSAKQMRMKKDAYDEYGNGKMSMKQKREIVRYRS